MGRAALNHAREQIVKTQFVPSGGEREIDSLCSGLRPQPAAAPSPVAFAPYVEPLGPLGFFIEIDSLCSGLRPQPAAAPSPVAFAPYVEPLGPLGFFIPTPPFAPQMAEREGLTRFARGFALSLRLLLLRSPSLPTSNHSVPSGSSSQPRHLPRKWRRERDSNPRFRFQNTSFPGMHNRPLCHLSLGS